MRPDDLLVEGADELGIHLDKRQCEKFHKYLEHILEWNKKINLTSVIDPNEIVLKHFLDSLTVIPLLKDGRSLLDIGTGAGFPGVPVSIVKSSINVTLLDSTRKKVIFLNHITGELNLENVQSFHARAEDRNNGIPRCSFDYVVTRAVGDLKYVTDLSGDYINNNGKIILMRGKETLAELKSFKSDNFEITDVRELRVPKSEFKRVLVVLKKK